MLTLAQRTLKASLELLYDTTLTLKRYPKISSGIDKNVVDFAATPTTVGTYRCNVQVYNRQAATGVMAQNYGGLVAQEGRYEVFCEPITVSQETDIIEITNPAISALVKVVVWSDASHTHLIVDKR